VPVMTAAGWKLMADDGPLRVRLPRGVSRGEPASLPGPRRRGRAPAVRAARAPVTAPAGAPVAPAPDRPTTIEDALARGMDRGLFDALSAHRAVVARQRSLPAYVVAPNRTLTEIALLRPRCLDDLTLVHGMGPARLSAYGEGLLAVVREAGPPVPREAP
jgi:ATP-dependent DNA helicase RecQ